MYSWCIVCSDGGGLTLERQLHIQLYGRKTHHINPYIDQNPCSINSLLRRPIIVIIITLTTIITILIALIPMYTIKYNRMAAVQLFYSSKPTFSLLVNAEKTAFSKLSFQCLHKFMQVDPSLWKPAQARASQHKFLLVKCEDMYVIASTYEPTQVQELAQNNPKPMQVSASPSQICPGSCKSAEVSAQTLVSP